MTQYATSASTARVTRARAAFTLIELLVVIAIIALLASLVFPVTRAVNKRKAIARARTQMAQVEIAIEAYKMKLGHYPPDNPGNPPAVPAKPEVNQLYYELVGTTLQGTIYTTKDKTATLTAAQVTGVYGTSGFVNCTKGAGGDEGQGAIQFLGGLKPDQYLAITNSPGAPVTVTLGTAVEGPLMFSSTAGSKINPWRYISSGPTNNPGSFDLWVDVLAGGKVYRICNWSKQELTP